MLVFVATYFCSLVYFVVSFMLVFVVVLRGAIVCKQVYGFVFVAFVYNFNVK